MRRMKRFKIRWLLFVLVFFLVFLIAGAVGPFLYYKKVAEETKKNFSASDCYRDTAGVDGAMLLETNKSAWDERIRLFHQAKERIILSTFDMRDGKSTRDLLAVLYHKAEEGIKIKILVDGVSGTIRMEENELFYALSSHPNVEIKIYNKLNVAMPWKTQGRMHDKYVIVDELAYILGGRNTFDYFIGDYPNKNMSYDREVLIYNTDPQQRQGDKSSLYQVEAYFSHMWKKKECRLFHDEESLSKDEKVKSMIEMLIKRYEKLKTENPDLFKPCDYNLMTCETNKVTLLSNPTGIYGKEPVLFYELSELMKQAKERVIIHTPYVVLNGYMKRELTEIAGKVPDSRMVINSVENGDNFMASSDYLYRKKGVYNTGLSLLEYDGGVSYHGKSVVIDEDMSIIGSYNMDLRSTYVDTELMLAVQSKELTEELTGYMDEMEKDCRVVTGPDTYEVPEHIQVEEIGTWKKIAMRVVGLIMQPFRSLV